MYMSPTNVLLKYLEPLLRMWLETNGFDLSKEYKIALVKMRINPGVDVYAKFGPCGPFPWYKIVLTDPITNKIIESTPFITLSRPTDKFSENEVVIQEYESFNHVGRFYTFLPNQVQVPAELVGQELTQYNIPKICRSNEGLDLALHY